MKQCKFSNRQFDSLSSKTRNKIIYKVMKKQMPFKQLKKVSLPTFTFSIYLYTVYIDLHPENHRSILSKNNIIVRYWELLSTETSGWNGMGTG